MPIDTNALETVRPSRRSVVRGAAWSVPVISVAATAPAFASSTCADGAYQVRWGTDYVLSTKTATANRTATSGSGVIGSSALTVKVTSQFAGSMAAGSSNDGVSNLVASPWNVAGGGGKGLAIMQRVTTPFISRKSSTRDPLPTPRSGNYQQVTLTFNRPVWDLKYVITDIDSSGGQYQDRIIASGNPAFTLNAGVTGGGSASSPWQPTNTNQNWDPQTDSQGNVLVDYTGQPAASVYTLTYWNDQAGNISGDGLQGVFLGTLTFGAETCS